MPDPASNQTPPQPSPVAPSPQPQQQTPSPASAPQAPPNPAPVASPAPQAPPVATATPPQAIAVKKSPIVIVSIVFLTLVVLTGAYYSLLAMGGIQSGYMTSEPSLVNYFTAILISNIIFAILWIVTIIGLWLQKMWGKIMFAVTLGIKLLFTILLAVMFLGQNIIGGNDLSVGALLRSVFVLLVGGTLVTLLFLTDKKA